MNQEVAVKGWTDMMYVCLLDKATLYADSVGVTKSSGVIPLWQPWS
jgi:hypothetical protein